MEENATLTQALGWFSLGLGLVEVLAPRRLAKAIGVPDNSQNEVVLRLLGLREIVSGLAILGEAQPAGAMWSRFGGDMMDLTLLGATFNAQEAQRERLSFATAAVLGVTALDLLCSEQLSRATNMGQKGDGRHLLHASNGANAANHGAVTQQPERRKSRMDVKETVTINKSPEELYTFWHDFQNLARFMLHLESVQPLGEGRSHWKAKAPAGQTVEWDAEIVDDQPNRRIAWQSLEGADIKNAGAVHFEPATGGRGTIVRVQMQYAPPGGAVGAGIAKLFGEEPAIQVYEDLRRFKQVMETGEVVRSDGSIEGMGSRQRPGQPSAEAATG